MAGLIAALFGGKSRPPDPDPLPGQGGFDMPPGPYGGSGFPGSTSSTRTFKGKNPRAVKIRADSNGGFEQALSGTPQVRQSSYRGDVQSPVEPPQSPRDTPEVATPQPLLTQRMQDNSPAEFFGGQPLKTRPGYDLAGINPLSGAAQAGGHSVRDTETEPTHRWPVISTDVPGSENVRNQIAQRYKNRPGQQHTYRPSPRPDQQGSTSSTAMTGAPVTVQNRFVFAGGGVETYGMERQAPYPAHGSSRAGRGATLTGERYYQAGPPSFENAGDGMYGVGRLRGPNHRPTMFQEPAPWSTNYYDTTAEVGTTDNPGTPGQTPDMVYMSPSPGRASNSTGRTG